MSRISKLLATEVLNSRGEWTIKVHAELESGLVADSQLPLGRSRGPLEQAVPDLRGVCAFISTTIARQLTGRNVEDQRVVDDILREDLASNPFLGNTLLPVSVAVSKLAAIGQRIPLWRYLRHNIFQITYPGHLLPVPFVTLFMGGLHKYPFIESGIKAHNSQVIQLVLEARTIREALELTRDIYRRLSLRLISAGQHRGIGQDGGIAYFGREEEILNLVMEEMSLLAGILPNMPSFGFAVDVAATHLKLGGQYELTDRILDNEGMFEYLTDLVKRYPIWSIEDPFHLEDTAQWQKLGQFAPGLQVVGDDLFSGSPIRIRRGVAEGLANGFILKPDFVGTVSDIASMVNTARESGVSVVVSHRSGDTCDSFVADLAAAIEPTGAFGVGLRAGAPYCGERVAKWNRLLEIEREAAFRTPLSFQLNRQ